MEFINVNLAFIVSVDVQHKSDDLRDLNSSEGEILAVKQSVNNLILLNGSVKVFDFILEERLSV